MSQYPVLFPLGNISSNTVTYNDNKFKISASSYYPEYPEYGFFSNDPNTAWVSDNVPPPHWICLESEHKFITDNYIFTAQYDLKNMTVKDYYLEVSIDGIDWTTVYTGVVPKTNYYNVNCTFNPILCKYIRLKILSNYDNRGYKWVQAHGCRVYGKISYKSYLFEDNLDNVYA